MLFIISTNFIKNSERLNATMKVTFFAVPFFLPVKT
jgi:hypothetical protein